MDGGGLRGGSHSSSCTAWEGVMVDRELAWEQARVDELVSIYLDSGRCHLLLWGEGQSPTCIGMCHASPP